MDQKTRKLITLHTALYPRDDIDRLYVNIKERGRGVARIDNSGEASMQQLEDYI